MGTIRCTMCRGTGEVSYGFTPDGERNVDACDEPGCTAWADMIRASKRCSAAAAWLREQGFRASTMRETIVVGSGDCTIQIQPSASGGWSAAFTRGSDPVLLTNVMAALPSSEAA